MTLDQPIELATCWLLTFLSATLKVFTGVKNVKSTPAVLVCDDTDTNAADALVEAVNINPNINSPAAKKAPVLLVCFFMVFISLLFFSFPSFVPVKGLVK